MEGASIHHIALRVSDCVASMRFYVQAFELREIRRIEEGAAIRAIWLDARGTVLMLEKALRGTGPPQGSGHVLIFTVDDLQSAAGRLRDMGVAIVDRTPSTLYVEDPDGHRAGVSVHRFDIPSP